MNTRSPLHLRQSLGHSLCGAQLLATLILFWGVAVFLYVVNLTAQPIGSPTSPNVLVIYTDEHHFNTLGCYGGTILETPHIDSIAENGARCTRFYAATPVCSPSRASFISGRYPQNTGVEKNDIPLNRDVLTFGTLLRRAGYATGWAGKWHLAGQGKPQWQPPERFGFEDNRYMFNRGHWKKFTEVDAKPQVASTDGKGRPSYGLEGADERSYATDWLVTKAIEFVNTHRDQPFCYVVSLPDPHGPNRVRPPYNTMFVGTEIPIPASFRKPESAFPGWAPKNPKINPRWLRANLPQYYGMVKCIDDNVGRILTTLRRNGQLEDTVILFSSDHGDLCGEHGRSEKGVPYEGSARIPFLLSYPGVVPADLRIDRALTSADVLPTLMGLLGCRVPDGVDGRDASALFRGETSKPWDDIAIIRSTQGKPWISAISNELKLVLSTTDEPWLFDLGKVPEEVSNQIEGAEYQGAIHQLIGKLKSYEAAVGDPYLQIPRIKKQIQSLLR